PLRAPRGTAPPPPPALHPRPRTGAGMLIAGLMAGTSADALDIALVEFREALGPDDQAPDHQAPAREPDQARADDPDHARADDPGHPAPATAGGELTMRLLATREVPFDPQLHGDILRLLAPGEVPLSLVSSVDARLGRASADAVADLC